MTAKYLVDTDWVIDHLNGHEAVCRRLAECARNGLAISIVSLAELYEGTYYSRDPAESERKLTGFLEGLTVLGIDDETCRLFGKERGRLRAAKKQVGDFDLLIGMTPKQHQLTLLTNNRRHFTQLEGLVLESL
jgi:tRNA(fMet)-specific endonuclease VapC